MAQQAPRQGLHGAGKPQPADHRLGHPRDTAGVAEIIAHEPLDAEESVPRLDAEGCRDPHLLGAGELVGRFAGGEMKIIADPHEKLAGITDGVGVGPGDTPREREIVEGVYTVDQLTEPAHELDVAKPAGRPFDIGLQERDGVAKLLGLVAAGRDEPVDGPPARPADRRTQPLPEKRHELAVA